MYVNVNKDLNVPDKMSRGQTLAHVSVLFSLNDEAHFESIMYLLIAENKICSRSIFKLSEASRTVNFICIHVSANVW